MSKIVIRPHSRAVPCPFCGLNTVLLPDEQKVRVGDRVYCLQCERDGVSKMHIAPRDFYAFKFDRKDTENDYMANIRKEAICKGLTKIEIAHLHGEYAREDDMYLDFIYDKMNDKPYFRMLLIDDDDAWSGTEVYHYLSAEEVHELLRKNGIYIFSGMTEFNWKSYIGFA